MEEADIIGPPEALGLEWSPSLAPNAVRIQKFIAPIATPSAKMPLVEYPDSESDEAGQSDAKTAQPEQAALKGVVKRRRSQSAQTDLPPLPSAFFNYYSTSARVGTSDNPSLHGGRKRTIPHVEGMWPSHVYLECKDGPVGIRTKWLSKLTYVRDSFTGRVQ
jgi:hypothetical protein